MNLKLLALSDLHLEVNGLRLPPDIDCDVAVLAGDIVCPGSRVAAWVQATPALRRARAAILVAGNHEHYDGVFQHNVDAMRDAVGAMHQPPLHLLDCTQVVIDGVRFLGCTLWTDFELRIDTPDGPRSDRVRGMAEAAHCMADYRAICWLDAGGPRRLVPQDTLQLHRLHRAWLARALAEPFAGPTVVVTHHGPHRGSLAPRFAADWVSTAYLSELPAQFFQVPVLWIHGHTHSSHDYRVGRCRVVCNPRGYQVAGMLQPENPFFDPTRVLRVERTATA